MPNQLPVLISLALRRCGMVYLLGLPFIVWISRCTSDRSVEAICQLLEKLFDLWSDSLPPDSLLLLSPKQICRSDGFRGRCITCTESVADYLESSSIVLIDQSQRGLGISQNTRYSFGNPSFQILGMSHRSIRNSRSRGI